MKDLEKILKLFGKSLDDLRNIAKGHSYHPKVIERALCVLNEQVKNQGFQSWNMLVDAFRTTGHSLRVEFSRNPDDFYQQSSKWF